MERFDGRVVVITDQVRRLRGVRRAGPPPRPSTEPIRVHRRASTTGLIMVAGQKVALGRLHQHQTVAVLVCDTTLAIELPDGEVKVVRRTTTQPVRSIKGQRPRTTTAASSAPANLGHCLTDGGAASPGARDDLHDNSTTVGSTAEGE
jgi:hypothetical protein